MVPSGKVEESNGLAVPKCEICTALRGLEQER